LQESGGHFVALVFACCHAGTSQIDYSTIFPAENKNIGDEFSLKGFSDQKAKQSHLSDINLGNVDCG
jgi:hypothetical protein